MTTDRRTVGDILLARGYISQAQLEHAVATQHQTGKPLGQVLVEAGAITRLELASALAEQWSDTATWLGPPDERESRGRGGAPTFDDGEARDIGFYQRLQEAVVELARRVATFEPVLAELRLRVEQVATAGGAGSDGRVDEAEHGIATLTERLDQLTAGLDRAFTRVEEGSGVMAGDIEALAGRLDVLTGDGRIDALEQTLAEVASRPVGDPALAANLQDVVSRLEEVAAESATRADASALIDVRARVESLASRIEEQADTSALDALRATLDEMAARPQPDPGLADRLDELAARVDALAQPRDLEAIREMVTALEQRPVFDPDVVARIDDLATRVDKLRGDVGGLADTAALDALRATLAEVADRPGSDPALAIRLEELAGNLTHLQQRIDAASTTDALDEVRARTDELQAQLQATVAATAHDELRERIDGLRASLDELASGGTPLDPELDRRLDHVVSRVEALHARIEEVASTPPPVDDAALAEVRARLDELAADPATDAETERRLDHLVSRLDALHARIEEIATTPAPEPDTALTDALRAELEGRIAGVEGRADSVAHEAAGAIDAWTAERTALESRIDDLSAQLVRLELQSAQAVAPAPAAGAPKKGKTAAREDVPPAPQGVETELEKLRMAIERINLHLGERERAISQLMRSKADVKVDELAVRITELERNGTSVSKPSRDSKQPSGSGELGKELRILAERVEEAEKAAKTDREKVLTQLERMASSIDWRFRRLESGEEDAA
jgi:chromosome segregation ATPase